MKRIVNILFLSVITCSGKIIIAQQGSDWTSLFNGKDLNGWFVRGKAVLANSWPFAQLIMIKIHHLQ